MAIYTQYGRYLKAKMFKEMLDSLGDTYMVLGIGNPLWDDASKHQRMPVSPYNLTDMLSSDAAVQQFHDENARQYYIMSGGTASAKTDILYKNDGDANVTIKEDSFLDLTRDMLPPFPCIWQGYSYDNQTDWDLVTFTLADGTGPSGSNPSPDSITITQNTYHEYYIDSSNRLNKVGEASARGMINNISTLNDLGLQCFAELRLRGEHLGISAKTSGNQNIAVKAIPGLIGALKCNISFVRDLGTTSTVYTGEPNQFWYGDRYWETVNDNDITIDDYINDNVKYFPHHLLITSTVNPRVLHSDLAIDKNIRARQIALYTRRRVNNVPGNNAYRVSDYLFNFGQYTQDVIDTMDTDTKAKLLNFTLECSYPYTYTDNGQENTITKKYTEGDFKFVLNDYIKGTTRTNHSVDKFGYVIGF